MHGPTTLQRYDVRWRYPLIALRGSDAGPRLSNWQKLALDSDPIFSGCYGDTLHCKDMGAIITSDTFQTMTASATKSEQRLKSYIPALLAVVLGLGLTFYATYVVDMAETSRINQEIERRVENHIRALDSGLTERLRILKELSGLYAVSETVSRNDFRVFLKRMDLFASNIHALAWLPETPDNKRGEMEDAARQEGVKTFVFRQLQPGGGTIAAARKDTYLPVFFCEPEANCSHLFGLDLASVEELRLPLKLAKSRFTPTVSDNVHFIPDLTPGLSYMVPIFEEPVGEGQPTRRTSRFRGYLVGFYSFSGMVEGVLGGQTAPSGLDVYFFNASENGAEKQFYLHRSRRSTSPEAPISAQEFADRNQYKRTIRIADHTLNVVFLPVPNIVSDLRSNEPIEVFLLGVVLTSILTGYLLLNIRKTERIETLVAARTIALRDANAELKDQAATVEFLRTIAVCANEAASIEEALQILLREVCTFIDWPVGHAYAIAEDRADRLRSTGIWWSRKDVEFSEFQGATEKTGIDEDDGFPGSVLGNKLAEWHTAPELRLCRDRRSPADTLGLKSAIGLPVIVDTRVVAVLEFFSTTTHPRKERLLYILSFVGTQLARVIERTAAAENLLIAKNEAEHANRAKSKFLAAASHDLRQPLQAMNLFINVLAGNTQQSANQEIVDNLRDSSNSLEGLLNALLNISKLEAGMVVPKIRNFRIKELFERLEMEFRPLAELAGLQLRTVSSNKIVRSDPALLEDILRNLLTNALRYTKRGKILLGGRRVGSQLRIGVWDTGIGIGEHKIADIFTEFYQVEPAAEIHEDGLGLGLAVVDRLARLLQHRLHVESTLGSGSVFALDIPLANTQDAEGDAAVTGIIPTVSRPVVHGTVLVVDDEPNIRKAMRLQLEAWGHRVLTADSLESALETVTGHNPDLILADYRLGQGETGNKAISSLRQHLGRDVPGILISGDTAPKRLRKAKKSGFQLLHKPVPAEALRKVVDRELAQAKPEDGVNK